MNREGKVSAFFVGGGPGSFFTDTKSNTSNEGLGCDEYKLVNSLGGTLGSLEDYLSPKNGGKS